jgi:cytochrome d ubiquinol oxidase subunit II
MTWMSFDTVLPVIFKALMGVSMLVYVISDGYDLVRDRWFALPDIIALMAIPLMTAIALLAVRGVLNSHEVRGPVCWLPFVLLLLVFVLGFLGLAYSIYLFVVIGQMTIWQAASSPEALKVVLFGTCISVPAIAGYTVFSYRVFRGQPGALKYA